MKPIAWTDGRGNYFDKNSFFPVDDLIPLYTHPVKELTKDEMRKVINEIVDGVTVSEMVTFLAISTAILRKAQE